jgi:hypothetical protein
MIYREYFVFIYLFPNLQRFIEIIYMNSRKKKDPLRIRETSLFV